MLKQRFTVDTKIKDFLNDEEAKRIIEKYIPGASSHPQLFVVKNWPIKRVMGLGKVVGLTKDQEKELQRELESLTIDVKE